LVTGIESHGAVNSTDILEAHSELEKAFPYLFKRLKAQEELRMRQEAEEGLPPPRPSKKVVADESKKAAPATATATPVATAIATPTDAPAAAASSPSST
jgi:hypothetical protein